MPEFLASDNVAILIACQKPPVATVKKWAMMKNTKLHTHARIWGACYSVVG
jgi:hypothetical protein